MAAYATETLPSSWDDERDTAFFRITAELFSCEFTSGAGVLLASYDEDYEIATTTATTAELAAAQTPTFAPADHVTAL